jgi:hypothetical protein
MIKDKLIEWMPVYYEGEHVNDIQDARDAELQIYQTSQNRVIGDMYASTAQDIDKWENEYGLVSSPDESLLRRQQNMVAYIRGGGGAVTKDQILMLINSYTGTNTTEITEYPDQSIIRITCHLLPSSKFDLEDMKAMLYDLIQGHVGVIIDAMWNLTSESDLYFGFRRKGGYIIPAKINT